MRVVVLAARRQALLGRSRPQGDPRAARSTGRRCGRRPRASSSTSRSCTGTSSSGSATVPKITIAAVQGVCSAAGLMLACMCDLIVAADDARFSNPVARMSGVGVELLVEPWELGPRKAKEFLLCATTLDAADGRAGRAREPGRAARRARRRGARDGRGASRWCRRSPPGRSRTRSTTPSTAWASASRWQLPLHGAPVREQHRRGDRPHRGAPGRRHGRGEGRAGRAQPDAGTAQRAPGPRSRHAHRRAVLRRAARRAGRRGHQDRAARHRRLHARDRAVRPDDEDAATRCSGRSRDAAARASR